MGATFSGIALPIAAERRFTRSRLVDEVTSYLRELIISGQLESGTQLLQIDLANRLNVSRTPLREAFRVLERDGLIRVSNGNKTVEVAALTATDLVDMFQIREVLDGLATRLCAEGRFTEELEVNLRQQIEAMAAAADSNDLAEYGARHAEFHLLLFRGSGNLRLADEAPIVRISSQVPMIRYIRGHQDGSPTPRSDQTFEHVVHRLLVVGNDHHETILSCLQRADPQAAEEAARIHMRKSAEIMAHYVAKP